MIFIRKILSSVWSISVSGRGSSRIDRAGTPPHWREGNNDRISMKDYRDREQQRAAEERWSKSIRQPEQDDIDPRVYGRYDDKAEERKQRDQQYRPVRKILFFSFFWLNSLIFTSGSFGIFLLVNLYWLIYSKSSLSGNSCLPLYQGKRRSNNSCLTAFCLGKVANNYCRTDLIFCRSTNEGSNKEICQSFHQYYWYMK